MKFLGVDLAWKDGNPSGVALLAGAGFPLHLPEMPHTHGRHHDVLEWIDRHVARQGTVLVATFHPEVIGEQKIHRYFCDMVREARRGNNGSAGPPIRRIE